MTIRESLINQPYLRIPIWVITALVPLFLTLIGVVINQARVQQNIINTIQYQDEALKDLRIDLSDKVGRQEYNELRTYMMRIEDKLDRVIERTR